MTNEIERTSQLENQIVPAWYAIAASSAVVKRKPIGVKRFGEAFVLWRADDGRVVCLPDRCSHRSAALSAGKVRDGCLECPYHGLRFDSSGHCVLIPANGVGAPVPPDFDLPTISTREEHGIVWLWRGAGDPAHDTPWIPGASELVSGSSEYWLNLELPYLRIVENLLDFHHFPILHKTMIPGVGTRMDEMDAHVEDGILVFSATMRYEKPGALKRDTVIKAWFTLPSLALIDLAGFHVNYFLTPIDDHRCWIYARYQSPMLRGLLGTAIGKLAAVYDRAIFTFQDRHALLSQVDPPGDFSKFKLYPADRALALFFGMRKQAILDANRRESVNASDAAAAAG